MAQFFHLFDTHYKNTTTTIFTPQKVIQLPNSCELYSNKNCIFNTDIIVCPINTYTMI